MEGRSMRGLLASWGILTALVALGALASNARPARADELLFHDGTWLTAMVDGVTPDGKLRLRLSSGEPHLVVLEDVVAIYLKGRDPRSIRSGMQEFRLVNGDRIRGRIQEMAGDDLVVRSHAVGTVVLPMATMDGFVGLPVVGRSGRRAEQLLVDPSPEPTGFADVVLDRRATTYEGVIEAVSDKKLTIDHERMMRPLDLPILYLAGVRLADREKREAPRLPTGLFLRVHCRDGTSVDGFLEGIEFGRWSVRSLCEPKKVFSFPVAEMVLVEILNSRTLYLSQMKPAKVEEKSLLAPRYPYRMNRNCLGNRLVIGRQQYAWGIGVHAQSALTFDLRGKFAEFHASIGVDKQVGGSGSVAFAVLGDGRSLYRSPLVRGGEPARKIEVPVAGVRRLTLRVEAGADLDLGDCADWAMARLVRRRQAVRRSARAPASKPRPEGGAPKSEREEAP